MEEKHRPTSFSFSHLIMQLYGEDNYHEIKSYHNLTTAKKYYLKILKSIKFSVEETIIFIDKIHKDNLIKSMVNYEALMKKAKNLSDLDQLMITLQSELIFLLIGEMPYSINASKIINRRETWKLNRFRQIQYTQSPEQKASLIFKEVTQGKYTNRFGSRAKFSSEIYWKLCDHKPEKLVEWLKTNHPEIYLDIF